MNPTSLPRPLGGAAWAGRTVGLLGGSFNPPHHGHLHDSLLALRLLNLDQVWWMVSPQNPLKSRHGMAPFDRRLAAAARFTDHPRIIATDIEARLGTFYTSDTLKKLTELYPRTNFVWLMGADNLIQIRHWQHWTRIFEMVPVAVFDRPPYSLLAGASLAARHMARWRRDGHDRRAIAGARTPAWAFFHTPLKDISSTALRDKGFWPYRH